MIDADGGGADDAAADEDKDGDGGCERWFQWH